MDEDGGRSAAHRYRGMAKTGVAGSLVATVYNLVRLIQTSAPVHGGAPACIAAPHRAHSVSRSRQTPAKLP